MKSRHFDQQRDAQPTTTKQQHLELMRLEAERERITKFKHVASQQTRTYYRLLEHFVQILDQQKDEPLGASASQTTLKELSPIKKQQDDF